MADHDLNTINPFSLAAAKKAYAAGVAGAIAAIGSVSIAGLFTDGKVDTNAALVAVATVIGGFVLGFFGAWLPSNAQGTVKYDMDKVSPEQITDGSDQTAG